MQKILLAINALKLNTKNIDFAAYVARLTKSKLIGLFFKNLIYEDNPEIKRPFGLAYVEEITSSAEYGPEKEETIRQHMQQFTDACVRREINGITHLKEGDVFDELINETRFADLIIIDPALSFLENEMEGMPSKLAKQLLSHSECPVLVAPETFEAINEIVFAFNGSKSSVFAIKHFTYLFPELGNTKVSLLEIEEGDEKSSSGHSKMREWLSVHYKDIDFHLLHGKPEEELFKILLGRKNVLLIMGAFGRNMLSTFFHRSTAELIVKAIDIPIFIAHA